MDGFMADLVDFRGRITDETNQVLEAVSRSRGRDKSEIVRDVLHEWALTKINEAMLIQRLTRSEGTVTAFTGGKGNGV